MNSTRLERLSGLVLADLLAALPLRQVVRLTRLGSPRLRQTCSLKWVTARCMDVTFMLLLQCYEQGGQLAASFCTDALLKRLHGRIVFIVRKTHRRLDSYLNFKAFKELASKVPGKLLLHVYNLIIEFLQMSEDDHYSLYVGISDQLCNHTRTLANRVIYMNVYNVIIESNKFPNLVYACEAYQEELNCDECHHDVSFRFPALNGRNVLDVMRAVSAPADVSSAELDAVREITEVSASSKEWLNCGWFGSTVMAYHDQIELI